MSDPVVSAFQAVEVPALNYHLWRPCNMRCAYCFAHFDECIREKARPEVEAARCVDVIRQAAQAGISKITFSGGEPTLCPWLFDAVAESRRLGLTTMVVSNGTLIDEVWLARYVVILDWLGLSVDSLCAATNSLIGRCRSGGMPCSGAEYQSLCRRVRAAGVGLKINTVVSAFNHREDFAALLDEARPARWKLFQALEVRGQNDAHFNLCRVSDDDYAAFLRRHDRHACLVPESNAAMRGTYLMINPEGCFFDNAEGAHRTSLPVWQVGWESARAQVRVSARGFHARGGDWEWARSTCESKSA